MGSNCLASTSIGCLFCCQGCNAEKLRNAFVFLPPPPSYNIEGDSDAKDLSGDCSKGAPAESGKLVFLSEGLKSLGFYQQAADHADVRLVRTARGQRIPVVWLRRSRASSSGASPPPEDSQLLVILHCHGNATDIGMMMGPYFELTRQLGVEVVGVEYSGYGMATGVPSTKHTQADIEAAFDYVVASGVPPERIVAYGQSVGSGPVLSLASKRQLGGIILHSPMMSGIKVIDPEPDRCCRPSCVYKCFDFYPNDKRMRAIKCPAFVIHGQADDIIPFYHGEKLSEAAPKEYKWPGYFPRGAGHNDIVEQNTGAYFGELSAFLRNVLEHNGVRGAKGFAVGKPLQCTMADCGAANQSSVSGLSAGTGDLTSTDLPYAEPTVGPEDGRYQQWRRGGAGWGDARDLQTADDSGHLRPTH